MFSPLMLRLAIGVALIGAAAGIWWAIAQTYRDAREEGYKAGKAEVQTKLDRAEAAASAARIEFEGRIAAADQAMKDQSEAAARLIADAQARERAARTKVQGAVRANPRFAVIERPADLRRVRSDAFAELEQAAERGARLSGAGLPSVPASAARGRPDPGGL